MKNNQYYYSQLAFDTKLFGYSVARIKSNIPSENLPMLMTELKQKNFRLAYWSVDPKNEASKVGARCNNGFLADNQITYKINLSRYYQEKIDHQHLYSYLNKPLNRQLLSLSLQSGFYSRYRQDKKFARNEFRKLYTAWMKRSLSGEIAEDIIVYVDNDIEKGFITLEKKDNYGRIGLIVVDKKYRGKSVGKLLVNAAFEKFKEIGITEVKVTTQKKNIIACKFYEKIGFSFDSVQNTYHFWLNE